MWRGCDRLLTREGAALALGGSSPRPCPWDVGSAPGSLSGSPVQGCSFVTEPRGAETHDWTQRWTQGEASLNF